MDSHLCVMPRKPMHLHLQRKLNTFDVTNLVVGSIIGADIYVATGISSRLIGPSSLLAWVLAGVMATVIAVSFAYCATLFPRVGGPYAYVKEVSTPFNGFIVGWALLLAEWFSLAVFPVAFAQYFSALTGINDPVSVILVKAFFIVFILVTNIVGVKSAGKTNDILTIAKLSPLLIVVIVGIAFLFLEPAKVASNMNPFFTGDPLAFGQALVLIFWAYAGFELSTLPADEVENPKVTIPRAIAFGMLIVVVFYLLTNLVVVASVSQTTLAVSNSPLLDAANSIFSFLPLIASAMFLVVGVGALVSILGADESGTIGTSRLTYAMSIDGLLPKLFSKQHPKYNTPYVGLIVLGVTAFVASVFGGLTALINSSVFLLAFVYLATCLATLRLLRKHPDPHMQKLHHIVIPVVGAFFSLALVMLVDPIEIGISVALLVVGIPVYAFFTPKQELKELKAAFYDPHNVVRRAFNQQLEFLAYPVNLIKRAVFKRRGEELAFKLIAGEDEKNEKMRRDLD
ncbi:MAG TPA: amino acid permease [Methanomassiliicoccales archaeon]|nr:amino acid permease [Methanomassiliicoccales archaeon]